MKTGLPIISAITEIELLCWKTATDKDMQILENFLQEIEIIEISQTIKYKTAAIRKTYNIKLADAIIAATGLIHNLNLVTRNSKDFENVKELTLINPWDM